MTSKDDKYGLNKGFPEGNKTLLDNPFTVPDGYFDELESRTLLLSRLSEAGDTGLNVPDGYFGQLQLDLEARIAEEKLKQLVPADGFTVPEGYFDGLNDQILNGASPISAEKEPVIRRLTRSAGLRYIAAAVALFFSVFLIKDRLVENHNPLSEISDQELIQYLQFYGDTGDALIISENISLQGSLTEPASHYSVEDIEWYLENTW